MVEIVVSFTDGSEGSDYVVLGSMLVIKGSLPEPMSEGIHAESRLNKIYQFRKRSKLVLNKLT